MGVQVVRSLPFAYDDYLELVNWSGRAVHPTKRGKIPDEGPPILQRLGVSFPVK